VSDNDVLAYSAVFISDGFTMKNISNHIRGFITKRRDIFVCLCLFVATSAVYWQLRNADFVNIDDPRYVYENSHVMSGLTWEGVVWAFTTTHAEFWHPLTWLSHMLDYHMFGDNPAWHHLTNLLLHLANTILFFLVLNRMTRALWQSAFVAALFAVHPLHVESVAWVAERKDLLSIFFWMLTLHAYVYYARGPGIARYLVVLTFFCLGLMAKPMLVTLPFVMLLLDYWPLGRLTGQRSNREISSAGGTSTTSYGWRTRAVRLLSEKVPLVVLAVIFSAITLAAQHKGGGFSAAGDLPLGIRAANAFVSYWKYIGMTIWPQGLAPFYPVFGKMPPFWQWAGAGSLLVLVSALAVRFAAKYPYLTVGWFWFLGTLLPVIGLVQIGRHAIADRYTYLTINGLFIVIAWGVPELLKTMPYRKVVLWATAAVVLTASMMTASRQVGYWRNSITLFEHTLKETSDNYLAHNNLGAALYKQGRTAEAIEYYLQSLRIDPAYEEAHYNLATALDKQGRTAEAIEHYLQALRINPGFVDAHNNLAATLYKQGRTAEAIDHYFQALRIDPAYEDAHNNLAAALDKQGRTSEAIEHYFQALRIDPDHLKAHYNLATALDKQGRTAEAIEHYLQALRIDPYHLKAHYNLGNALYKQGRTAEAIEHYSQALQIDPAFVDAHNNLGVALLRKGDIDGATARFREALRIDPDYVHAKKNLREALLIQQGNR
jgi:tetratricopeptide (TPR) repeat protein